MTFQRDAQAVIADWRAVERDIRAVTTGTSEWWALFDEAERLRDEYGRLVEEARDYHRFPPPPFPLSADLE